MIWVGLAILAVTVTIAFILEWQFMRVTHNLWSAGQVLLSIDQRLSTIEKRLADIARNTAPIDDAEGGLDRLIRQAGELDSDAME